MILLSAFFSGGGFHHKECYLQVASFREIMSILSTKNISERLFNVYILNSVLRVSNQYCSYHMYIHLTVFIMKTHLLRKGNFTLKCQNNRK